MERRVSCILIMFILVSCSYVTGTKSPHDTGKTTSAGGQRHPEKKHIEISAHDPQRGIDSYKAEHAKHPNDQALARDFVKEVEDLRTSADKASENGHLAVAGRIYSILLTNFRDFEHFHKKISFTKDYLNTRLAYCKTTLSRRGFEEYRKGNLNEAIGFWQAYLSIEPNNPDIRKAVQTASAQQKNLGQKR